MPAKSKKTAAILPGGLESAYLLRLFFSYPPQDFAAYQQIIDKNGQPIGANAAPAPGETDKEAGAAGDNQGAAKAGTAEENAAEAAAAAANAAPKAAVLKAVQDPAAGDNPAAGNTAANAAIAGQGGGATAKAAAKAAQACLTAAEQAERCGAVSLPLFSCRFNLLTTLQPLQLKRLRKLPFYGGLKKLLTFRTLFLGTTVSEFAPLPAAFSAAQAAGAADYLRRQAENYPLVIVKDLPQEENALVAPQPAEAGQNFMAALAARGFMAVEGQALAYVPVDFANIEAFLARFSKARRKDFRRKLRAMQGLTIEVLQKGAAAFADEEQIELYYRLYQQVYAQSLVHFDLLTRDFFRALLRQADDSLRFITYRDKAGRLIGYNICFIVGNRLVDKYIGLDYPAATDYSLYFVSWFYNLAYAREQGLKYYVAGWTDPQVKAYLGAKFVMTRHAVYIRSPLLRAVLRLCRPWFEADGQAGISAEAGKARAGKAAGSAGTAPGKEGR